MGENVQPRGCGLEPRSMPLVPVVIQQDARGERSFDIYSRILVHQPSGGFQGQTSDIQIHAKEVLALRRRIEEIYAHHTGKRLEEISEALERDRFFTPEQANEFGLVDQVMAYRSNGYSPSPS